MGFGTAEVFRGKVPAYSLSLIPVWAIHGGLGVLGMWLLMRAAEV